MRLRDAQAWRPLLGGIDAVVNCVGVLQDGAGDDVQRIQFDGTAALFDACVSAGVKRVIHVSAIGAEAAGPSAFSRTKAAAEAHLKTLALDWVILRPALLLAPAVYGGSAMLRGIAGFPGCVPVIGADARVQVISADDVAETVARALAPDAPGKVVWDLAHPQVHSARRNRRRHPRLARLRAAPRAAAAGRGRKNRGASSPMPSAGWAGAARRAPPRSRRSPPAWSAIRRPGWQRPGSGRKASTTSSPRGRRTCRSAGSRGCIFSSRSPFSALPARAISTGLAAFVSSAKLAALVVPGISLAVFAAHVLPGLVYGAVELVAGVGAAGAPNGAARPHRHAHSRRAANAGSFRRGLDLYAQPAWRIPI